MGLGRVGATTGVTTGGSRSSAQSTGLADAQARAQARAHTHMYTHSTPLPYRHRLEALFFISFLVIGLFFLMNLILSTVYSSYGEVTEAHRAEEKAQVD